MRFVEANGRDRRISSGLDPSWRPPGYAVVEGPIKVIRDGDSSSYSGFNVTEDPAEGRNLLAETSQPDWAGRLRQAVDAHAAACEASREATTIPAILGPESRLELNSLGYPD
jgi:hypothetical protein